MDEKDWAIVGECAKRFTPPDEQTLINNISENLTNKLLGRGFETYLYADIASLLSDRLLCGGFSEDLKDAIIKNQENKSGIPHSAICFYRDGNKWCAVYGDFINIQESPIGFGDTFEEAMSELEETKP